MSLPSIAGTVSPLATPPVWDRLHPYQASITREEFLSQITDVYSPDGGFWKYARMTDEAVTVYGDREYSKALYSLYFAKDDRGRAPLPEKLRTSPSNALPLRGLRICLDPGHIGGKFAQMEERYFQIGEDPPVEEAELNLITCRHLASLLEDAGAEVVWTKGNTDPVTPLRPEQLRDAAIAWLKEHGPTDRPPTEKEIQKRSEQLFYRSAEIRARADLVQSLDPDLTVCVHYNAAPWKDPRNPSLTESSRLVLFVSGAFMEDELAQEDQRFDLLRKVFERSHPLELQVASTISESLKTQMELPPESYAGWKAVRQIGPSPYVFARNLAANRTFPGSVVFVEGPYMNASDAYPWIIAGDYDGEKEIGGKTRKSIHRVYAQSMADGIIQHFRQNPIRRTPPPETRVLWNP